MTDEKLSIEYIPIQEITPYAKNPRKNDRAINVVAESIKEFGFKNPIILDKNNIIVAGHTRLKAAEKLGIKEVPVIWADDLTEEQIRAFRIMDNKSTEYARWEVELLKGEMQSLQGSNFPLELTGFKETEINRILAHGEKEANAGKKEPKYKIMPGEIWALGAHRIMCTDAKDLESYNKLFNTNIIIEGSENEQSPRGQKAGMIYTDPPYGVSYKGTNNPNGRAWDVIEGDELRDEDLYDLLKETFKNCNRILKPKRAFYVFHASRNQIIFEDALNEAGLKVKQQLIWQKHLVLGHSHYHWAHEPIFYGCRKDEDPDFFGDRIDTTVLNRINPDKIGEKKLRELLKDLINQSTIWQFQKDRVTEYLHPTQKPIRMAERAIINSSQPGDIVLDPFLGSGSTLMAAEATKRKCYGFEIDPTYMSHIIERWEDSTSQKAQKM